MYVIIIMEAHFKNRLVSAFYKDLTISWLFKIHTSNPIATLY